MRIKTGIDGLDEILQGGLLSERVYLLSGPPGSGKTTFCVQYLAQGAALGEVGLYVSLVESPQNIIDDMSNYSMNVVTLIKMQKLLFADLGPRMDYGFIDDLHERGIHEHDM
ncbi:MAG: ATPase domain-containing protein, partial [Methanolobus sp.]